MGSPHPVEVWCDHKNLTYYKSPQALTSRQHRWQLILSQYNLRITHVPGAKLIQADALSRRPDHYEGREIPQEQIMIPKEIIMDQIGVSITDTDLRQAIISAGRTDQTVTTVIEAFDGKAALPIKSALKD